MEFLAEFVMNAEIEASPLNIEFENVGCMLRPFHVPLRFPIEVLFTNFGYTAYPHAIAYVGAFVRKRQSANTSSELCPPGVCMERTVLPVFPSKLVAWNLACAPPLRPRYAHDAEYESCGAYSPPVVVFRRKRHPSTTSRPLTIGNRSNAATWTALSRNTHPRSSSERVPSPALPFWK